jgi:hypothetical protein
LSGFISGFGHWELFSHYGLGIGHSPFTVATLSVFAKQNPQTFSLQTALPDTE